MAKLKPARRGKSKAKGKAGKPSPLQALPCLIIILGGMGFLAFLFYLALRSA